MGLLEATISGIGELDSGAMAEAQSRQDQLTKPQGSLGMLEELSIRLAGIFGETIPPLGKKVVIVMAGDHGVVEEGVSRFPREVTPQMVLNFLRGGAAINVLARHAGAEVRVVDVGVATEVSGPGLIVRKVRNGTANMTRGPAMSREEAVRAIEVGIEVALEEIDKGALYLATGDMGIGNTTPSSAITSVLVGEDLELVTGRGTGLDEEARLAKVEVIRKAIALNEPDPGDPLDVLSKVGGLEIAGIAGVILGAASRRRPVVIDGFISAAGALVAAALAPSSQAFMVASHLSMEPGHRVILDKLGLRPVIHADMRLGEGTGAALTFFLLEAAVKILAEMATFDEAGVSGPVGE